MISNLVKLKNPTTPAQAKLAADPFWQEMYELIFQLRHLQMICCPDSWSHQEESRISNMNAYLKEMYERLSGGNSFHQFNDIKSKQIGELALAWSEGREPQFDFDPRSVLHKDPERLEREVLHNLSGQPIRYRGRYSADATGEPRQCGKTIY